MKILWLCNKELNSISTALNKPIFPFGGWLEDFSERICKTEEMQLVCLYPNEKILEGKAEKISYYSFNETNCRQMFISVLRKENPDVIHIFGTEFGHSLKMTEAAKELGMQEKVIISIQGLVSVCAKHYTAFLPDKIIRKYSIRDFLKHDNIRAGQLSFEKRGKKEVQTIRNAHNIIGRTDWDEACVKAVNPSADYYFCNETLRESFYNASWNSDTCEKHSVFFSQCSYPIKGFHLLLDSMPQIISKYPDAKVYIAGNDVRHVPFYRRSSYQNYLLAQINNLGLENHVVFCGQLSEEQMLERYQSANAFVLSSSIENSPNSLGEAMLIGCPCVSADVGGVRNMLVDKKEGFVYPADEPYMIAYYIEKIFESDELAKQFSENASEHARMTHDRLKNFNTLMDIYKGITSK